MYEQPQAFASSPGNVPSIRSLNENDVVKNSKGVDRSSSVENKDDDEEIYDEDYEFEETEDETAKHYSASPTPEASNSNEDNAKYEKLNVEQPKDSPIDHDDAYYYYDDYENVTSPENSAAGNIFDGIIFFFI